MIDKNINHVLLSGIIVNIKEGIGGYILFTMKCKKYSESKYNFVYVSLSIYEDLYNIYKDIFVKDNEIFIKGYINSYVDNNKNYKMFISVIGVSKSYEQLIEGKKTPYIRFDPDGVMVWNGKRCESTPLSEEELKEMDELLNEFR